MKKNGDDFPSMNALKDAKADFHATGDLEGYDQMLQSLSKVAAADPEVPFCAGEILKIMRDV